MRGIDRASQQGTIQWKTTPHSHMNSTNLTSAESCYVPAAFPTSLPLWISSYSPVKNSLHQPMINMYASLKKNPLHLKSVVDSLVTFRSRTLTVVLSNSPDSSTLASECS